MTWNGETSKEIESAGFFWISTNVIIKDQPSTNLSWFSIHQPELVQLYLGRNSFYISLISYLLNHFFQWGHALFPDTPEHLCDIQISPESGPKAFGFGICKLFFPCPNSKLMIQIPSIFKVIFKLKNMESVNPGSPKTKLCPLVVGNPLHESS